MDFVEQLQGDNFLVMSFPGDEPWCCQYDPNAKVQPMEWRLKVSPHAKRPQMSKQNIRALFFFF
jgi:hypothetical protein